MLDAPDARTRGLSGTSQRIHATWIDAIGRTAVLLSGSDIASTIGSWPGSAAYHGTRKGTLLKSVPLGVTTRTVPVLAPAGRAIATAPHITKVAKARLAQFRLPTGLTIPSFLSLRILRPN
jgi:hypothetical protein